MNPRLERVYRGAERMVIDQSSRIVCMSDCHRGVGNRGDNFLPNSQLFLSALRYYYQRGFWYMELGDGDELWENRDFNKIKETHDEVFQWMYQFHCAGCFRMLYGNHDAVKKNRKTEIFPGLCARESILLTDRLTGCEILLLHGHQGDFLNDTLAPFAGLLVRILWRPLELLGVSNPTSAAYNYKKRKKTEKRLERYAEDKQMLVIAGHTHRSTVPKPGEGFYLNDGCCVHPGQITALELENGKMTLVKWHITVNDCGVLSVSRVPLSDSVSWNNF